MGIQSWKRHNCHFLPKCPIGEPDLNGPYNTATEAVTGWGTMGAHSEIINSAWGWGKVVVREAFLVVANLWKPHDSVSLAHDGVGEQGRELYTTCYWVWTSSESSVGGPLKHFKRKGDMITSGVFQRFFLHLGEWIRSEDWKQGGYCSMEGQKWCGPRSKDRDSSQIGDL